MSETHLESPTPPAAESSHPPSIDELLVRSIARWALVTTVGIALFDLAILASYPFPDTIDGLRGPLYGLLAVLLLVATIALTFLGYRIVTMRIVRRSRAMYGIFLPAMSLVASLLGFAIMTSPK